MAKKFDAATVKAFLNAVIEVYERLNRADRFMFAFRDIDNPTDVYTVILDRMPTAWVKHSCTSDTGEIMARLAPTNKELRALRNHPTAALLGNYDDIYSRYVARYTQIKGEAPKRRNNGEAFECAIVEANGGEWAHNNTAFYIDGDITIDGVRYQIKSPLARLLTASQLERLQAHAR